ncbi:MAG: BamA/TamA family outer membrane protein [Bacteroidia bacterium]|nr:BamA/TamA family outer membrane protein [Bacteroidia bacterium]
MNRLFFRYYQYLFILFVASGCSVTSRVPKDEYLLSFSHVTTDNINLNLEEINTIIKQKPNRRILKVLRFHLRVYNVWGHLKKDTKLRNWLETSIGEEPVVLDTSLTVKSTEQISLYLKNKGYFNNKVTDTTHYFGKQARVVYKIKSGKPYTIGTYNYAISDSAIRALVVKTNKESLIKYGNNFDVDVLENERVRLTSILRNNGYFFFNKEFFEFTADSSQHKVNLILKLRTRDELKLNIPNPNVDIFSPYIITNIIIDSDFDTRKPDYTHIDSLYKRGYLINYNQKLIYKPNIILRSIFFQQGDLYNEKWVNDTYQSLSELKAYRYINITFTPDDWDIGSKNLKCNIQLSPVIPKSYSVSSEGTNSSGNLGVNGNFVFQNRNTFKGAQIFEFKMYGGLEIQKLLISQSDLDSSGHKTGNQITNILNQSPIKNTFNTFEISPSISYEVPKIWPFSAGLLPKKSKPHTIFAASYNYQVRPDFSRTVVNSSLAYRFKPFQKSNFFKHLKLYVYPLDLNIISIAKTDLFFKKLITSNNPLLLRSFTDVFIAANKFSFTLNTQDIHQSANHYSFFKIDLEQAGSVLQALNKNGIIKAKQNSHGTYYLFDDMNGIPKPYAQYWKTDFDYRYYQNLIWKSSLAYRVFAGISRPYGNSGNSLPFQKSYFTGGTNDIRAFRARAIGPGEYNTGKNKPFDKIGDIKLLGSAEYRFTVYKAWKAALFADAGNIWLYKKDSLRPGAEFNLEKFYNQLALGSGIGLRYDFEFFIIRLDLATPLYDPLMPFGKRNIYLHIRDAGWRSDYKNIYGYRFNPVVLNLGIGYPF